MPKPYASTAYCLAYFTYVDRYVDNSYQLKYFKIGQRIANGYMYILYPPWSAMNAPSRWLIGWT